MISRIDQRLIRLALVPYDFSFDLTEVGELLMAPQVYALGLMMLLSY